MTCSDELRLTLRLVAIGAGVEPELAGAGAVDHRVEGGRIDLLLEVGVGDPGDRRDALPQLVRDPQVVGAVVADGADVDLRRQAEIENLRHDVGRLEIEQRVGERGRQHGAQLAHVVRRRRMSLLQRDQDDAVIDADGRAVGEGEVVGARRQADVVDDPVAVAVRNDLADLVLDLLEHALGRFDPRSRGRPDVELDLAAVDEREEVVADELEHDAAEAEHQDRRRRNDEAPPQQRRQQGAIAVAQALEAALEAGMDAAEHARGRRCRHGARP